MPDFIERTSAGEHFPRRKIKISRRERRDGGRKGERKEREERDGAAAPPPRGRGGEELLLRESLDKAISHSDAKNKLASVSLFFA